MTLELIKVEVSPAIRAAIARLGAVEAEQYAVQADDPDALERALRDPKILPANGELVIVDDEAALAKAVADTNPRHPLRRIFYSKTRDRRDILLFLHHVVSDGWSMSVLLRELRVLYESMRR